MKCMNGCIVLYKSLLNEYNVSDILVTGSSSGATLALGLVSYINISKKDIEVPKRIYASSPGECFKDEDLIKKGEILDKKDIFIDFIIC